MGIFDAFKKDKTKNIETMKKNSTEISTQSEKGKVENEEVKEKYILTKERCSELIQRIFKDEDHGKTMIEETSLSENIFILGYIENSIMPELKNQGKEQDYLWFYSSMAVFRKIVIDKIMDMDRLWKVMLTTTGLPFLDRGCEHILVCDNYKDNIIKNLENVYYNVDIVEINKEDLKNEIDDLYRKGYKGICFSDGVQRPYYFSKESFISIDETPASKYIINPETQYNMAAFFQEIRRNVNYEGCEKIRENLENAMINSIVNTNFVIPIKKTNSNQVEMPVYIGSKDEESGAVKPGIYVFTDKIEAEALEKNDLNFNHEWDLYTYTFSNLMKLLDEAHIEEICINCGSINFKINEKSLGALRIQSEKLKEEMIEKQEKWETIELPKMLKDKTIPIIKDINNITLFARKGDSVLMSKFVFDILIKRELKAEIMNLFFNDEDIKNFTLYDRDFKRITLKLKDDETKSGIFILPMRYDDENDSNSIDDNIIHYTENAAVLYNRDNKNKKATVGNRTMHFYTIENRDTNKVYIPIFSNENEAEKIYARDKFRYCMVSYNEILKQAEKYDGIVINPASMSFIFENNLLKNIYDIIKV